MKCACSNWEWPRSAPKAVTAASTASGWLWPIIASCITRTKPTPSEARDRQQATLKRLMPRQSNGRSRRNFRRWTSVYPVATDLSRMDHHRALQGRWGRAYAYLVNLLRTLPCARTVDDYEALPRGRLVSAEKQFACCSTTFTLLGHTIATGGRRKAFGCT